MKRPITTLFLMMSLDGKISTGATDDLDFDKDFPKIIGLKEGLHQYYEIEHTTDLWSLNSGRVQAKVGVNEKPFTDKCDVSFVVIDNSHLKYHGLEYFSKQSKCFVLVTSNKEHPAFEMRNGSGSGSGSGSSSGSGSGSSSGSGSGSGNINIILQNTFDPAEMLAILFDDYGCERITIQTGGTLNEIFLRAKLLDYVDIIVAPVLIGGKDTATVIDGDSLRAENDLSKIGVLQLIEFTTLNNSYVRLRYKVIY